MNLETNNNKSFIYKALDNFLTQKLALKKGERLLVFLLQVCICLIVTVLLILKPLFSGMMLSAYSVAIMPLAYILIAIFAVVIHFLISALQSDKPLFRSILINQWIHVSALLGIGIVVSNAVVPHWMTVVLYVYASLYAVVTVSYFYQYCQSILTIRDAKRLYGYIGAGAIAGGIIGGYLTNALIDIIDKSGLLYLSAIFLIITCAIYYYIDRLDSEDLELDFARRPKGLIVPHALSLLKNRHIFNIAMLMGLGVVVSRLVDYQFSYLALEHVASSNDLASFFGFWFSTINVIGFIIQLFVVHIVVERFGITYSLLSMPVLLLLGLFFLIFFPVLFFGILVKSFDGSLKQSIYKTGTELVIMPLSPSLRRKAKTFIDVVVDSLATGFAGFLIYSFSNLMGLSFMKINALTVMTCCVWIFFIIRSSKSYNKVLFNQIEVDQKSVKSNPELTNVQYVKNYINDQRSAGQSVRDALKSLMIHDNHNIRVLALREYGRRYYDSDRATVYEMTNSDNSALQAEAYRVILSWSKTPESIDKLYRTTKLNNQPYLLSALADTLHYKVQIKKYGVHSKILKTYRSLTDSLYDNYTPMSEGINHLFRAAVVSRCIEIYPVIESELSSNLSPAYQKASLDAIAYGADPYFFDRLLIENVHVGNNESYYKCLATFPSRLLAKLKANLDNPNVLLRYLPACSYMDNQKTVNFLFQLLDHKNIRTRRKALYMINYLKRNFDYLNYSNIKSKSKLISEVKYLKKLMGSSYVFSNLKVQNLSAQGVSRGLSREINSSLVRIFIFIGLITERDDMHLIYSAIKSKRQNSALDILDSVLPYRLRKVLVPIIEIVVAKNWTLEDLRNQKIKIPSNKKAFKFVRSIRDTNLNVAINAYLKNKEEVELV